MGLLNVIEFTQNQFETLVSPLAADESGGVFKAFKLSTFKLSRRGNIFW